jgi:membrane-associated phospholipid phosphatase
MQQPFNEFTPWYLPQGYTGNYSFVSGHTMTACFCLFLVSIITTISPKLCSKRKILNILAVGWIICVAFSRVIYGAHFASDVTMGAILGVTLFLILKKTRIAQGL